MFGHTVRIYGFERTLCDFIKNEKNMNHEVYVNAIKAYKEYDQKDINLLYKIAARMGIADKVAGIMEIIV